MFASAVNAQFTKIQCLGEEACKGGTEIIGVCFEILSIYIFQMISRIFMWMK